VLKHDVSDELIALVRVRLVTHLSDAADESTMDWPSLAEASIVAGSGCGSMLAEAPTQPFAGWDVAQ
jgi:hypothetical protein